MFRIPWRFKKSPRKGPSADVWQGFRCHNAPSDFLRSHSPEQCQQNPWLTFHYTDWLMMIRILIVAYHNPRVISPRSSVVPKMEGFLNLIFIYFGGGFSLT